MSDALLDFPSTTSTTGERQPDEQTLLRQTAGLLIGEPLGSWTPLLHSSAGERAQFIVLATPLVHPSRTETAWQCLHALATARVGADEDDSTSGPEDRVRALAAFDSLKRWLDLTDQETATLVGISARSIPNWRNQGQTPYPSTVRRLYETHNLLAALVRHLGLPRTRVWLQTSSDGDRSRLDAIRSGNIARVTSEASPVLFPLPPKDIALADEDDQEEFSAPAQDSTKFTGKVRTARRAKR